MTTPSPDEQPTQILLQATVGQPAVTTVPATRRARIWQRRVPARVGRARTSTVVIGCLFVLLFALNSALPQPDSGTTNVVLPSGQTVPVPNSALPSDARPTTTAPTTTSQAPASTATSTTAPASTTGSPRSTTDEPTTTAPRTTTATPRTASTAPDRTTSTPTTSRAPASSSAAPATTAGQTSSAPTS
ncbi:MAG: hypothetical protein JWP68_2670 [Modestobacter sp.]|nr:hypothetical protein [Modestobacter sp.]